jgi:CBS domain containing-hemolysin-like protein
VFKELPYVGISVFVLLGMIGVGVVFDVIGVAVTAAREAPLHARAARRVPGARRATWLVRNAHQVASFCNDVIGDVSGTLSGAIGISIVYQLFTQARPVTAIVATTVMSGLIAGLVVGGKAYGKVYALKRSTDIVFEVGRLMEMFEHLHKSRRQ